VLSCALLEKNRAIEQLEGESNFHIFYLLFLNDLHRRLDLSLPLSPEAEFRYIVPRERLEDSTELLSLQQKVPQLISALDTLGLDSTLQRQLLQALAGILLLGNIRFKPVSDLPTRRGTNLDDVECCVDELDPLVACVATLLGKEDLATVLAAKVIQGLSAFSCSTRLVTITRSLLPPSLPPSLPPFLPSSLPLLRGTSLGLQSCLHRRTSQSSC
jgi:hypothetical protein